MHRVHILIALAAGFLGGLCSRYALPPSVSAAPPAPREIRAQRVIITDQTGNAIATFEPAFSGAPAVTWKSIAPVVVLVDRSGREIWQAPNVPSFQLLGK